MNPPASPQEQNTLFGHPAGLFTLFFAEMWERFSYYGMRALLTLYMIKGFLGYGDSQAYTIYGAYTALVYMTPFFGGMIADRLLGQRKAVVLGGSLMAAGHLFMRFENETIFFVALALLILGNGFFKPNISTIVGSLYPKGSTKRDGGFTLFYIGINLGAAMAPLLCGYIGETYGWHHGFGLATYGMLIGLAVFVLPTLLTQALIILGALVAAGALFFFHAEDTASTAINIFVGVALIIAGGIATMALQRGGLPKDAGLPLDPEKLRKQTPLGISAEWVVYLGTIVLVPVFTLLVWGFAPFNTTTEERALANKDIGTQIDLSEDDRLKVAGNVLFDGSNVPAQKREALEKRLLKLDKIKINPGLVDLKFNEEKKEDVRVIPKSMLKKMSKTLQDRVITEDDVGKHLVVKPHKNQEGGTVDGKVLSKLAIDFMLESGGPDEGKATPSVEFLNAFIDEEDVYDKVSFNLAVTKADIGREITEEKEAGGVMGIASVFLGEMSSPAGLILVLAGIAALVFILREMGGLGKIARERMYVVMIMTFFSLLFWAIFEQAGSSVNLFTDRNVDRVNQTRLVTEDDVGETLKIDLTQEQLGYEIDLAITGDMRLSATVEMEFRFKQADGKAAPAEEKKPSAIFTIDRLDKWRKKDDITEEKEKDRKLSAEDVGREVRVNTGKLLVALFAKTAGNENDAELRSRLLGALKMPTEDDKGITTLKVTEDFVDVEISEIIEIKPVDVLIKESHVGMGIAEQKHETKASIYQALNPAYILILGLAFTALWGFLGARKLEPSTPVKFAFGLAQLGLGFGCFWMGAAGANEIGMVEVSWLYLGYLLQTTGELCLSPVGLSMVTKLSPSRLVSTVMGMWFLATAFSAFLAAIIAQFTGVEHGGDGGSAIPAPSETVHTYGDVFGLLAITGLISGAICLALAPFLKRWMHEGVDDDDGDGDGGSETEPTVEEPETPPREDELPPAPEGSEA